VGFFFNRVLQVTYLNMECDKITWSNFE